MQATGSICKSSLVHDLRLRELGEALSLCRLPTGGRFLGAVLLLLGVVLLRCRLVDCLRHRVQLQWPGDVHVVVEANHGLARIDVWETKLHSLVETVKDRAVEVPRSVGRTHQHELRGRRAGVVEHRGQGIPEGLAHDASLSRDQECVCLVDEQQYAAATAVDPLEELVELGHSLLLQGSHVAPRHDCVLKARVLRKTLGHHRLSRTGRTIEHDVLQGHAALLGRACRVCKTHHLLMQVRVQHDVIELCAVGLPYFQEPQQTDPEGLHRPAAVGRPHQRRPAEPLVQLLAQEDRHLTRQVDTSNGYHDRADGQHQVLRRAVDCSDPREDDVRRRLDCSEGLLPLLLSLGAHLAKVHVLVLTRGPNLGLLLHLGPLYGLLDGDLSPLLLGLQAQEEELLFALLLLLLLSHIRLLLLLHDLQVGRLFLRQLMRNALLVELGVVVLIPSLLLATKLDRLLLLLPPDLLDASLHEGNLHVCLRGFPLLDQIQTSLTLNSCTELRLEVLDERVLCICPVAHQLQAMPQGNVFVVLLRPELVHVLLEAHKALLRLYKGYLQNLDLGNRADDLVEHVLSLPPIVVLLLDHCNHLLLQLVDRTVPVVRPASKELHGPDGDHQDVALPEHHHVLGHVGHALGVRPTPLREQSHRTGHDALQLLGHDPELTLGEELVVELVLTVVELAQADLLQLGKQDGKVGILDVLLESLVSEEGLVHAGRTLQ
mmetsp:Transcript_40641/g.91684  ORF Transcript_40641/g.91684 Transcript_40641/m.91684 type:complete len:716 (-) Transcript_40641:118-2265(-)